MIKTATKEYYDAHKEEVKEYNRKYHQEHKEKHNEQNKEWRKAHPEICGKYLKEWKNKNKDKVSEYQREYNTKHKDYINERESKKLKIIRDKFFEMYGSRCACCGETTLLFLTLDHILNDGNIKRDGRHNNNKEIKCAIKEYRPDLYQVLCMNCNWGKHRNGGVCPHKQ